MRSEYYSMRICILLFLLVMPFLSVSAQTVTHNKVRLVTSEREPYIGKDLPAQGYVHEVVTESFKRVGYEVEIEFYPLVRAKWKAMTGEVDGLIPFYYEKSLEKHFIFSDTFPGDHIGLLKKKSLEIPHFIPSNATLKEALGALHSYNVGAVREGYIAPVFNKNKFLNMQFTNDDLQNLDKLDAGRIDIAVIDKYTAADLMVNQRPHLIGQLEFVSPFLFANSFNVSFSKKSKNNQALLRAFNRGLEMITQDGTLNRILSSHGLFFPKIASEGKTKLTIGAANNSDMMVMKRLSREFEFTHPHIELEWRVLDENILRKRLLADLAISDGQFDIMTIGAYETPIWAEKQWLKPINNLPESYDINDVIKEVRNGLSYQNTLYALPFSSESTMTFYRKDLFAKAGVTMPDKPTYEDIMRLAKAVHDPENGVYGIGLRGKPGWGQNMAYLSILVNSFGGRWFDMNWKPTIDSKAWKDALMFYKSILSQYGHPDRAINGWKENQDLFKNGELGILIDATVVAGKIYDPQHSKVHDKTGFAVTPYALISKGSSWLWSWALAIPKSSKAPEEATEFITWATSKEYIERVADTRGWVTVPPGTRISTYNENYQKVAPFAPIVLKAIQNTNTTNFTLNPVPYSGIQFVAIPEFPAIGHQVGLIMAKFLADEISIEKALQDSQSLVDIQMKKSGYH